MATFTERAPSEFGSQKVVSEQLIGSKLVDRAAEFVAANAILSKQPEVEFSTVGRANVLSSLLAPAQGAKAILVRRAAPAATLG